jgi:hypothetical protein
MCSLQKTLTLHIKSPSGQESVLAGEALGVGVGQADGLDVVAPLDRGTQLDESDVVLVSL